MGRNDIVHQVKKLFLHVSRTIPFRSDLDRHLIRAAMVFTFFAFSIQKWNQYTVEMLVPLISHSPVVFWLLPAFGVRGAGDLIEFEPGGEVSAFRTKHAITDVGIVLHRRERLPQLREHLHIEAVQLFGPSITIRKMWPLFSVAMRPSFECEESLSPMVSTRLLLAVSQDEKHLPCLTTQAAQASLARAAQWGAA
jgi:hypothetical protein